MNDIKHTSTPEEWRETNCVSQGSSRHRIKIKRPARPISSSCQNHPVTANGSGRICLLAILDSFNNLLGINLVALKRADWGMFRQAP